MTADPTKFVLSLAALMATRAGATLGTNLFVGSATETDAQGAGQAYAVLRIYGGPEPGELTALPQATLQVMAAAAIEADALLLAQQLYEACYGSDGRPLNGVAVPAKAIDQATRQVAADSARPNGWILNLMALRQTPYPLGRESGRGHWQVAFNVDVTYEAA